MAFCSRQNALVDGSWTLARLLAAREELRQSSVGTPALWLFVLVLGVRLPIILGRERRSSPHAGGHAVSDADKKRYDKV